MVLTNGTGLPTNITAQINSVKTQWYSDDELRHQRPMLAGEA
jgi:hypothetical protein